MNKALAYFRAKVPADVRLVLLLFVVTRAALTAIGVMSRIILAPLQKREAWVYLWQYHKQLWLDIWSVWDSGWYLHVAEHWYDLSASPTLPRMLEKGQSAIAFFPLYPALVKAVGTVLGSIYVGALVVSNVSLIFAGIFLYRLVRLRFGSDETARGAVKYLFVFPTAFILSGVFTESLFLALLVGCFYYAERRKWLVTGVLGLLLSLTRSLGALAIIPLAWEYLRAREFKPGKVRLDALWLLLVPAGTLLFALYNYHLTGDWLAFAHVQKYWGRVTVNPLTAVVDYLGKSSHPYVVFPVCFTIAVLLGLTIFIRRIGLGYWALGMYSMLVPLSSVAQWSLLPPMSRFALAVFPLYILLGMLHGRRHLDAAATALLATMQGFLMVFWVNGLLLVV